MWCPKWCPMWCPNNIYGARKLARCGARRIFCGNSLRAIFRACFRAPPQAPPRAPLRAPQIWSHPSCRTVLQDTDWSPLVASIMSYHGMTCQQPLGTLIEQSCMHLCVAATSCHAMPCHSMSWHDNTQKIHVHVMSCQHPKDTCTCHIMSCHVMPCHVIVCHAMS
jgi:hypothetical protein